MAEANDERRIKATQKREGISQYGQRSKCTFYDACIKKLKSIKVYWARATFASTLSNLILLLLLLIFAIISHCSKIECNTRDRPACAWSLSLPLAFALFHSDGFLVHFSFVRSCFIPVYLLFCCYLAECLSIVLVTNVSGGKRIRVYSRHRIFWSLCESCFSLVLFRPSKFIFVFIPSHSITLHNSYSFDSLSRCNETTEKQFSFCLYFVVVVVIVGWFKFSVNP